MHKNEREYSLVMNDAESRRSLNVKITTLPESRSTLIEMLYPVGKHCIFSLMILLLDHVQVQLHARPEVLPVRCPTLRNDIRELDS